MTILVTGNGVVTASVAAPMAGLVQTFDYLPARDGLALVTGGPTDAGYAANRAANPSRVWQPRYVPQGTDPKGGSDVYSGNYQFNADPAYAWSNGYTPFSIVGGNLRIRAARTSTLGFATGEVPIEPVSGAPYPFMSGILSSKNAFSQLGGYFEMTAKLPRGSAAWSAFWLIPTNEIHPPEIDVIEYVSQQPANTYQATTFSLGAIQHPSLINSGIDLSQDFHNYAVFWTDTAITFYIDGTVGGTFDTTNYPEFAQPFYMLLNMQMGSRLANWVPAADATTPDTMDMLIKSVRAWQRPGPTALKLSSKSYLDNIPVGGTVATISAASNFGTSGANTATKLSDPDGMFTISGNNLNLAQVVPATNKSSHAVTLRLTDSLGRSVQLPFSIGVVTGTPTQANYITSSDLTSAFWTTVNVTATAADTIIETTANGAHQVYAANTIARTAGIKTFNTWIEVQATLGRPWIHITVFDGSYGSSAQAWFDVANGALAYYTQGGNFSGCTPFLSMLANGLTRVGFKFTTDASTTGFQVAVKLANGQDQDSYVGDVTKGMKLSNFWLYNINAAAGGS